MKVVQINTVVGSGSVGRITADLYEKTLEAGMQALVCFGRGEAPDRIQSYKISNLPDFTVHVLRNFFKGESGFGSRQKTEKLLVFLEKEKPDIIHLHNIHGFYINIELLFRYIKDKKIPVIWTLHDCWPLTGHCAYFDYVNCERWKDVCYNCPQQRSAYPYALFKDNSTANYRRKKELFTGVQNLTIVTPSEWLKTIVKQSFLQEYPVEVIYNGIDLAVFKPQPMDKAAVGSGRKKEFMILGVANVWEKRKGLSYFEELAKTLPETHRIVLIGVSAKQARQLAHKESKGILPQGKLETISRTNSREELAELYRKADVFVNATLEDNFPTTNLEALACGTPVITFATGGSPEAINEKSGIVVEKGNMEKLVQAVIKITDQSGEYGCGCHRECRMRALFFDKNERFREYIELYKKIQQ